MVPIQTFKNGQIIDVRKGELFQTITQICSDHKRENKSLAFGFILFNDTNPQIFKILNDIDYWRALDKTSGKYISLFYIVQHDNYFGQDLDVDCNEKRNLWEINSSEKYIPILSNYFKLDNKLNLPAVLFFQEHEGLLTDYFLLGLDEKKIEESFWELQEYIQRAVDSLVEVKKEYYSNSREIFNLLKNGVESQKLKRKIFKTTQKFPIQLLLGWITGKI